MWEARFLKLRMFIFRSSKQELNLKTPKLHSRYPVDVRGLLRGNPKALRR
jgi:hypothetical protein